MKYKISDLMGHVEDVEPYPDKGYDIPEISTEIIKEKTMKKINKNGKKRRIGLRQALLVAAVVSALAVTAAAVAASRVNVQKLEADKVFDDGYYEYTASAGESVINIDTQEGGKVVCCRPGWVPEDAKCLDLNMGKFSGNISYYSEQTGMSRDEVLEAAGMTEEEAKTWYTTFWNEPTGNNLSDGTVGSGRFFRVDIHSGASLSGKDLIMQGDTTLVREGEYNGMAASYLTEKATGKRARSMGDMNYILLYSEELNCLINVMGRMGFDELEKIAEGLELKQTGLEAPESAGGYSLFSAGVG